MCGIFSYVGKQNKAAEITLNGLKALEYRGYDSWGVAVPNGDEMLVDKHVGKISAAKTSLPNSQIAVGHCLHPSTLVQLSSGEIKSISEIKTGEEVCTVGMDELKMKNSRPITAWRHRSPRKLYEVSTPFSRFQATGAHQLFVALPNGEVTTRSIKDLSGLELIPIARRIRLTGSPVSHNLKVVRLEKHYLLGGQARKSLKDARLRLGMTRTKLAKLSGVSAGYIEYIETGARKSTEHERLYKILTALDLSFNPQIYRSLNFKTNDITLPAKTSKELLQVLGYHLGDGYCDKSFIRYKDTDRQILAKYEKLYQEIFNLKGQIEKKGKYSILRFNSPFLVKWLQENTPDIAFSNRKDVPSFVGTLPDIEVAYFLRGLFDAEGTTAKEAKQIKLCLVEKHVIMKAQLLLLRFGILSTFSESDRSKCSWRNAYSLIISDRISIQRFLKHIGFTSDEKLIKLYSISRQMIGNTYEYFEMPITKAYLLEDQEDPNISKRSWKNSKSYLMSNTINSTLEVDTLSKNRFQQKVKKYLDYDVVWARFKIKEVASEERFVYDLEVPESSSFVGNGVIQHNSRWATHGGVTDENAHPHLDCRGSLSLIHNGIVENYQELKDELKNHKFLSQTDTEVIAHHLEDIIPELGPREALRKIFNRSNGLNAFVFLDKSEQKIIAAKNGSPIVLGVGNGENFLASDSAAILPYTNKLIFLEDNQLAELTKDSIKTFNAATGEELNPQITEVDWKVEDDSLGSYDHYMIKEISEQPRVIRNIATTYAPQIEKLAYLIKNSYGTYFIGCGTAGNAALTGIYLFEKIAKRHVNFAPGSEFNYLEDFLKPESLIIALSQSGETIDVIEPVTSAKKKGVKLAAIVNNLGSTLYRMSDQKILLGAGPERCVCSTKAYTAKLAVLMMLAYALNGGVKEAENILLKSAAGIEKMLAENYLNKVQSVANYLSKKDHLYIIGRGLSYPSALEAALKIKEVSYIHAEGFAGGELKHGVIALIEPGTPCIVFAPNDETYDAIISNATELKARGAHLIGISPRNNNVFDSYLEIPDVSSASSIAAAVPAQLLAYFAAITLGRDPDKPRNLAKSVTVK
jgi:glutamine---fructose-6-phosphate transaminase (isomerizing)